MLAHQPLVVEEAANMGVGLVLSGHTHGGQVYLTHINSIHHINVLSPILIWPFGYLVRLAQPYVEGLHTHFSKGNIHTQMYPILSSKLTEVIDYLTN